MRFSLRLRKTRSTLNDSRHSKGISAGARLRWIKAAYLKAVYADQWLLSYFAVRPPACPSRVGSPMRNRKSWPKAPTLALSVWPARDAIWLTRVQDGPSASKRNRAALRPPRQLPTSEFSNRSPRFPSSRRRPGRRSRPPARRPQGGAANDATKTAARSRRSP